MKTFCDCCLDLKDVTYYNSTDNYHCNDCKD